MSDETIPQIRTRRRSGSDEALVEFSDLPPARRMGVLVTRLERIRRMQTNQMDLGTADLRILWLFADGRSRTLKEISEDLSLEQSTVNRQINAAINEGLLQRSREAGSAARRISPTVQGVTAFERDVEKSRAALQVGLDALGDDAEDFLGSFTRLLDAYEDAVRTNGDTV
ncbi:MULTISPECIES: MarR family winged helix-turn-helix transcriptional regulator [unclassified Brevibacterium]|uniref:MarR family winged helix-turn-helix transcriptional regulator n=1 Tax=unclassified Brevibacterium TaxID=2614124 RepID=UPI00196BA843|nr:MarR family winged helix-turn-helix transcriptional regulator [Brevibacterium sp. S111]